MNAVPAPAITDDPLAGQRRWFIGQLPADRTVVTPHDLQARCARALLDDLAVAARDVAADSVVVLVEEVAGGEGCAALRAALGARFAHVASVRQRAIAGSVLYGARHATSRILPLAAPLQGEATCLIHLAANRPLPVLQTSFSEHGRPAAAPGRLAPLSLPHPAAGLAPADDLDARRRAVGLVERLVDCSAQMFAQASEITRLRRLVGQAGSASVEPVRTVHGWPLRSDRAMAQGFYDHRVDDAALLEGDAGARYLVRHGLLGDAPDHAGAVAALNALPGGMVSDTPDVSIVIPVYGALGFTLNCLDSLLRGTVGSIGRTRAEIIVVDDASPDGSAEWLGAVRRIVLLRQTRNGGFIASCNAGARTARGRIVVFLNNDTRVVAGWLDALADSFSWFPRAGLVGSKMLYPDGALQEAGGIIWRDASCWNYGRNDDPNRPEYSHAREADYISGCSIALPTALFRDTLGGFDTHFAPAYCEDADLALRVRAAGHEVWFQPQSRVVHYEGRTSGTDTTQGVKAHQVTNGARLALRWRDSLLRHRPNGEAPLRERERGVLRRALVIDATTPTPRQDAGSVTTTLTLQLFRELGYKVHFVPQDNFLFQPGHTTDLLQSGVEVAYAPFDIDMETYLRQHGAEFDVVLVYRVTVLEKVIDAVRRHAPQACVLFHNMDLHFLRMRRQADLEGDAAGLVLAEAMKLRELALIRRVDCTITHSTFERDLLRAEVPAAPVVVFPFMFAFHGTEVGFAARRDFCFLGGYNHAPNVDAVTFFAREVLPLIHRSEPDARFVIAGANPTAEVLALAGAHVTVTGQIDDLRCVFDATRVFACSLRIGAGTKGKVSTAMAYGMPVVSTACGAEGMELVDGREVLLADGAAAFAAACLRAYRDPALWQRLSDGGQALVRDRHSLEMGRATLKAAIEVALRHRLGLAEEEGR